MSHKHEHSSRSVDTRSFSSLTRGGWSTDRLVRSCTESNIESIADPVVEYSSTGNARARVAEQPRASRTPLIVVPGAGRTTTGPAMHSIEPSTASWPPFSARVSPADCDDTSVLSWAVFDIGGGHEDVVGSIRRATEPSAEPRDAITIGAPGMVPAASAPPTTRSRLVLS